MFRSRTLLTVALGVGMAGALASPAFAQQGPGGGGPGGGPGGRGGRGNWDPQAMRQRMEQRMKENLGVTDEEWAALQPKIEKVQQLQMQARGGFGFGGFGRRGGGQAADNQPQSPVAAASQALRETLDNKDSTADQIKVKLQALRDARAKAHEELVAAQKDLTELLTPRQEAVLVTQGMLE